MATGCKSQCELSCNEVKYTIITEKQALDPERLCSGGQHTSSKSKLDMFELKALQYVYNGTYEAKLAVEKFQQVLLQSNDTALIKMKRCKEKFQYDVAFVEVVMDSETATQYFQTVKVTLMDKLANFGKV